MSITVYQANNPLTRFIDGRNKDSDSRLQRFLAWQLEAGQDWHKPDLAAWRDDLLSEGLAPSTVAAYLSTVRGRYREVIKDNEVRETIFSSTPTHLGPADRFALVNETLTRLQNAVEPNNAPVKVTVKQDRTAGEHWRLTPKQGEWLLKSPGVDTLRGIRNTAMLAVLMCTGLREGELTSLIVSDLRQYSEDSELCILVRHGKGDKQRLVAYGDLDWCLVYVDLWLDRAGITDGYVFRGMFKGDKARPGNQPLTTRAVQKILATYPLAVSGGIRFARPHDLRRSYAKWQYDSGMDLEAIRQNLGHTSIALTERYIGELEMKKRRGRAIFRVDLAAIEAQRQPRLV